ncbi:sigma-70 family RNA polymerase sigma factor [Virgibacillus sp. NKC19-3]|uniref:sigma-70 family RNA polymerase sigma factor n=1 Tax=Virgibacillus saliphilus TaxID=2831674 RepID=UPI001C9A31C1|nr:sigma-70 family RNA polymerase sigma factor [Virgibacillus sp. NKC19-3]MBY7141576.1 sigma-70 family RNA polymerase sigma factor [Virgibacillus sp. NKC19-3]
MKIDKDSSRIVKDPYNEILSEVIEQIKKTLDQPIMKTFLEDDENVELLINAMEHPTEFNFNKLDEVFGQHLQKARMMKYLINLIRIYSIDFDKKQRKLNDRFPLIVDKPLGDEGEDETIGSLLATEDPDFVELYVKRNGQDLKEFISSMPLYQAIDELTEKQKSLMKLFYVDNLSNVEISEIFEESPQNISNIHRQALKKLRAILGLNSRNEGK